MKTCLRILSLFTVFSVVSMKSDGVFEGTEGGNVEIRCSYPDDYKYIPKYLCRHPCGSSSHVLIKSAKIEQVLTAGRYSLIDTVSGKFFTVTIKNLRLKDSGFYYCGIDKWFVDKLIKVHLSVRPAAPVNRSSQTTTNTIITSTWTTTLTSAENSSSYEQFNSSTVPSEEPTVKKPVIMIVISACVLGLLVFAVLVAFVSLCKKRSDLKSRRLTPPVPENPVQDSPDPNRTLGDVFHLYDEIATGGSSAIYTTVQHSTAQDDVNCFYSLLEHH